MENPVTAQINKAYSEQRENKSYQGLINALFEKTSIDKDLFDRTVQMIWEYGFASGGMILASKLKII